jgi:hypothetical protein
MKTQEKQDEFIRKLVAQQGSEKAPDQLTDKIMARINAQPTIDDSPLLSKGGWIAVILGLAAVIIFIFSVNIPFVNEIFSSTGIQKVSMSVFNKGFFDTMAAFYKGLNLTSISGMIVAAGLGLVILDRLLRKRFSETRVLFI